MLSESTAGRFLFAAESKTKRCTVDGCERGARSGGVCGKHYQRLRSHGSTNLPPRQERAWFVCSIDGCDKLARTKLGKCCEAHYGRMRRNGRYDAPVWKNWAVTTNGYVMRRDLEHPLSRANGYVMQHRAVLYDAIGPGQHNCYWCACVIDWNGKGAARLVVDHLDGNKTNNVLSNLLPSCHRCNSSRGLFQSWVMAHRDDPFLWELYEEARRTAA
jgi:hypothetical protein